MASLDLHLDPCTVNSRKVLAALAHLQTPYTLHKMSYFAGDHKAPSYLRINPCGTVPCAVVDGSLTLTESNAIILYAAELAGDTPAYPRDAKARADIHRWLFWEASVWFASCYVYLVQNVAAPLLGGRPDAEVLKAQEPRWRELAGVLEGRLAETGGWICGPDVTVADLSVAASVHLWRKQRFPMQDFPQVQRWIADVEGLQCWRETQGAVDEALGG